MAVFVQCRILSSGEEVTLSGFLKMPIEESRRQWRLSSGKTDVGGPGITMLSHTSEFCVVSSKGEELRLPAELAREEKKIPR